MQILGLDGGIASIGWALLDEDAGQILASGVRCFDKPETDKDRRPTNAIRREKRGQRRVIRRRRQRMTAIRSLLAAHALLSDPAPDALRRPGIDPWGARSDGLDRVLSREELAVALGHIARHRGFRSNSKRDRGDNAADEDRKMLKALEAARERLARWRTVGEMLARDPECAARKRNRDGVYDRTVLRSDLEHEVRVLFAAQRRLGNASASETLEAAFAEAAFFQLPLQDSEHLLRACPFEPDQKRTARRGYAFELFRLLSRLANLRLIDGGPPRPLTATEIARISEDFGRTKSITFKTVRKLLSLDDAARFADVSPEDEKRDVVARSGNAAEGTYALRGVLGDAWASLLHRPALLDRIAEVLTFRESPESIRVGLSETGLEPLLVETLMDGVAAGKFGQFRGAGHISAKAARALLPHLTTGLVYSEACTQAGYDHTARPEVSLDDVRNPVARRALTEMLKQVRAIVQEYGLPDRIHVELARDVGKSAEERDEISRGIEKRNRQKDRRRDELAELLGCDAKAIGADDLLRYELYCEQKGQCLYTGQIIPPGSLRASDNGLQVDHILPWSRFGDDSFINKTLCFTHANQHKRGRTPFEWLGDDVAAWQIFSRRVEDCQFMKGAKKRGFYLRQNAAEVQERFLARNLGDTRYATRLLLDLLKQRYPGSLVLARPGGLTAKLRVAWGVDALKRDPETRKRREDDRHHALDAMVLAATSQWMLQRLTVAFQEAERRGAARDVHHIDPPWPGFREQAEAAMKAVFVSRSERRRARGEAHAATIKQVRERDGKMAVFERKSVEALKEADLDRIKDPERNAAVIAALRAWVAAGRPKDQPPRSAKGDAIRKVRLDAHEEPRLPVRGGTADRVGIVRLDIFERPNHKGKSQYWVVPIYRYQIANHRAWPCPPNPVENTTNSRSGVQVALRPATFVFSLYSNSLIEIDRAGRKFRAYFRKYDINTDSLTVSHPESAQSTIKSIGIRNLAALGKASVDRLGRVAMVPREIRTWHGEACT